MDKPKEKKCSSCGKTFPLTIKYFYTATKNIDGFFGSCKECVKTKNKKDYKKPSTSLVDKIKKPKLITTRDEFQVGEIKCKNFALDAGSHNTFIFSLSYKLGDDSPEDAMSLLECIRDLLNEQIALQIPEHRYVMDNIAVLDVPNVSTPKSHVNMELYMYLFGHHKFTDFKDIMRKIVLDVL